MPSAPVQSIGSALRSGHRPRFADRRSAVCYGVAPDPGDAARHVRAVSKEGHMTHVTGRTIGRTHHRHGRYDPSHSAGGRS